MAQTPPLNECCQHKSNQHIPHASMGILDDEAWILSPVKGDQPFPGNLPEGVQLTCTECRKGFTKINRQHHCRKCGHNFCGQCSKVYSTEGHKVRLRLCGKCLITYKSFVSKHNIKKSAAKKSSVVIKAARDCQNQSKVPLLSPPRTKKPRIQNEKVADKETVVDSSKEPIAKNSIVYSACANFSVESANVVAVEGDDVKDSFDIHTSFSLAPLESESGLNEEETPLLGESQSLDTTAAPQTVNFNSRCGSKKQQIMRFVNNDEQASKENMAMAEASLYNISRSLGNTTTKLENIDAEGSGVATMAAALCVVPPSVYKFLGFNASSNKKRYY